MHVRLLFSGKVACMEKASIAVTEQWTENDLKYMREAIDEAKLALNENEVPVGCVLVDKNAGRVVARGHNKVNASCNPTRHAEFEALDMLSFVGKKSDISIYVTCEPCCMCAATLRYANITDVIYGCANERFGGCLVTPSGTMPLFTPSSDGKIVAIPPLKIRGGLFADEAVLLLQQFYKQDNLLAPPEKRKKKQ